MGKKTKSTPRQKQQYFFILKGGKSTYYKNKIEANFAPSKCLSNTPRFNRDRKYFTPSFIIPSLYSATKINYLSQHESKIHATIEKSQQNILVPRPKPSKNLCGVCSKQYEDYMQHIGSQIHINQVKNATFSKEIIKLCQRLQNQQDLGKQKYFNKVNSRNTISGQNIEEDQSATKQRTSQKCVQFNSQSQASGLVL